MQEIIAFQAAIANSGLGNPDIIPDGSIHRFHCEGDKPGRRNGWYICYQDTSGTGGAFGSWRTGERHTWFSRGERVSRAERDHLRTLLAAERKRRQQEQAAQHEAAATRAESLWLQGAAPGFHPYLTAKRVLPFGIHQRNNLLLIPARDADGKLWTVQTIDEQGNKRFMPGGRIKSCFHLIGGPVEDQVFIAEGYSTGATCHMHLPKAKHQPVAIAFNAGNLKPVALALRARYPQAAITILADNDTQTPGNPGLEKAGQAMRAVGGAMLWPDFSDESGTGSDFNDLYILRGALL